MIMSKTMKTLLTVAMLLGLSISALARYVGSLDGILHEDNGAVVLADLQAGAFVNSHGFLVNPDSSLVTSGGAVGVTITTVVGLATVTGKTKGTLAVVTDGNSATDCTTGTGTTVVTCQYSGTTWAVGAVAGNAATTVNGQTCTLGSTCTVAANWTAARNLAGNSVDGSANVAFANKFIVQGTTDTGLSAAQFLGALRSGHLWNTTTTGVLTTASPAPYASGTVTTAISAATLCSTTDCPAGAYLISVYANEVGVGCTTVGSGGAKAELNFIDNQAVTRTAAVVPLTVSSGIGTMALLMSLTTTGTGYSVGNYVVNTNGSAVSGSDSIQILSALNACTTPGSWNGYQLRAYITRIG